MKFLPLILATLLLAGCGEMFNSVEKQIKQTETKKESSKSEAKGTADIQYPQPTNYTISASGNSTLTFTPESFGVVSATKVEDLTSSLKTTQTFSLDAWMKSVPVWLWPIMIMAMIGLIIAYIIWAKTTAAGRAIDAGLAGGIEAASKAISSITETLEDLDPKDPTYALVRRERDRMADHQKILLAKQRPKR